MLAHTDLTVLVILNVVIILSSGQRNEIPKQKNLLAVNEASFVESKDVLLQMLEKKLKEIKDHKKFKNGNGEVLPKNVDFNLKSNGISAVGEAELLLRYGRTGQGMVNLTAEGISNVGKVQLLVGTGDNGLHIPGLGNLFSGSSLRSGDRKDQSQLQLVSQNDINFGFRRQTNVSNANTDDKVSVATETVEAVNDDKAKVETDGKAKEETASSVATEKSEGATNVTVKGNDVTSEHVVTASNSSPIASSDLPLKSVAGSSVVPSNGESVNKV